MRRRTLLSLPISAPLGTLVLARGKYDGTMMATLKLEVFSDFQCPGCKQLHEGALRQLREEYVAKGKLQLTHREFPLPMHKYAWAAACLACAAEKLGKYGVVSDALFRDQEKWAENGDLEAALAKVLSPAELTKLRALAKDDKVAAEVDADIALGKRMMAQVQTPTMIFTKGDRRQPFTGAVSYAILRRYVEMMLAQ
jgi:protein-disulfide isomerase